jgi:hypothetical protein
VGLLQNALAVFAPDLALHLRYWTCSGSRLDSGLPLPGGADSWR